MSQREFASDKVAGRGTYIVTCGGCGALKTFRGQDFGTTVASEQIPKKLRAMGWEVGSKPEHDRCPACVNREREQRRRAKLKLVEGTDMAEPIKVEMTKAAPPRDMTRDERRLIFAKLDEVYLDEKRGYVDGWSDKRVAEDLGVARAWVAKIRDENFGPLNTNPEATALVEEAKGLLKQAEDIASRVGDLRKRLEAIERQF